MYCWIQKVAITGRGKERRRKKEKKQGGRGLGLGAGREDCWASSTCIGRTSSTQISNLKHPAGFRRSRLEEERMLSGEGRLDGRVEGDHTIIASLFLLACVVFFFSFGVLQCCIGAVVVLLLSSLPSSSSVSISLFQAIVRSATWVWR